MDGSAPEAEDGEGSLRAAGTGPHSLSDHVLQALLVNCGLVEDWEARIIDGLTSPEPTPSGAASSYGPSLTLRQMRRRGPLSELDETAQGTLLGSTLYQYSHETTPVRAAEARQRAATPALNASLGATFNSESSYGSPALTSLRHGVEQILQGQGGSPGGHGSEYSSSLNSTMNFFAPGSHGVTGQNFNTTVSLLEGHLSLQEVPSVHSRATPRSTDFGSTAHFWSTTGFQSTSGFSETARSDLGQEQETGSRLTPQRTARDDPAGETADSWAAGNESMDRTGHMLFSGTFGFLHNAELDASLVRSIRRVLQLGALLMGERLTDTEIENLPKVRFHNEEEQHCSICLEDFKTGEFLTQLPCEHFFHVGCISRWFQQSKQCPLCRSHCGTVSSP